VSSPVLGAVLHGNSEVKLFGVASDLSAEFEDALADQADASVRLRRNEAVVQNLYRALTILAVLVVLYVALASVGLGLGALGVFLLAVFRPAPTLSDLTHRVYKLDGDLPHLVRTNDLVGVVDCRRERTAGARSHSRSARWCSTTSRSPTTGLASQSSETSR
jgi:subfamily B ATP-binding cassette protein MsbA